MELREAVRQRRSIRQFLAKSVPEEIIREIISDALWAPSWGNTQPWEIVAVTGEALAQFKKENLEAVVSGKPANPEIPIPMVWPERLKSRYQAVGKNLMESLDIARDDKEGRGKFYGQMFYLFDAPALLMLVVDKEVALEYAMLDIGIIQQTICLLAHDRGLGTCIMAASISYPEIVHRILSIPESKRVVMGTALGWPDRDSPVNNFKRVREDIEEFLRIVK